MSEWGCKPGNALWCGILTIGKGDRRTGTETDSVHEYSDWSENVPDVDKLCPEGWYILERELRLTYKGLDTIPDFIDDQISL